MVRFLILYSWAVYGTSALWASTNFTPQEVVKYECQDLADLVGTYSEGFEIQEFVSKPYTEYLQTHFSEQDFQSNQLDLVMICDHNLTPMMSKAYDRHQNEHVHVDPELKLSLSNNPVFSKPQGKGVVVLSTSRGKMLIAYHRIQSAQRHAPDSYILVGRLLDQGILEGARLVSIDREELSGMLDSWPDIFGRPTFAFATIP